MANKRSLAELGQLPDCALITEAEACAIYGISHTTWWRLEKAGKTPKVIRLSERSKRYPMGQVRNTGLGGDA